MTSRQGKHVSAVDRRNFLKAPTLGGTAIAALPVIEGVERTLSPSRRNVQATVQATRQPEGGKNGASIIKGAIPLGFQS